MATGPAAARFAAPKNLSGGGQDGGDSVVDMDASGNAVFAWTRFDGSNYRIQAQARSAAGVFGPVVTLSPGGQDAADPDVAVVEATGDAIFTWRRFDGTKWRIQTVARTAAGALSGVQTLSDPGRDAFEPRVGTDSNGYGTYTGAERRRSAQLDPEPLAGRLGRA